MPRQPAYRGPTIVLPARLTPAMRRVWQRADRRATDEAIDRVWDALQQFIVDQSNGRDTH